MRPRARKARADLRERRRGHRAGFPWFGALTGFDLYTILYYRGQAPNPLLHAPAPCSWEDPQFEHDYCIGCPMCATWEGRTYQDIRDEHRAQCGADCPALI